MKWEGNRQSNNVDDRRGQARSGIPLLGGKLGIGTIAAVLVASYFLDINPLTLLGMLSGENMPAISQQDTSNTAPANDRASEFVKTVLADTEDTWKVILPEQANANYKDPTLVLFSDSTPTACGTGQTATGPFYCPADQKVYIDLSFFDLMKQRFNASGEFAQAYVIAHEVGHHVQHLLGISDKVHQISQSASEKEANALSVKLELQADCFAGVWGYHANQSRQILEEGDINSALTAASAIGDDTLQKQAQGYAVPDSFTHGTSNQRVRWFKQGITTGNLAACNTFETKNL